MTNFFKITAVLSLFFYVAQSNAQDKGSKSGLFQRAAQRETKRWTLKEWLETKERNRMMDLWLAVNSPSPYEAMFGIAHYGYRTKISPTNSETSYFTTSGQVSVYASLIGLTAEYHKNEKENFNDLSGLINFRIFGDSIQSTYLAIHFGQRNRTINQDSGDIALRQLLGQASMQLYLNKHFGIDGHYRRYQESNNTSLGIVTGDESEAGIFIDFKAFRIFGSWYQDIQLNTLNGAETRIERTGIKSGIKIFF